jgi:hypothetical protein
MTLDRVDEANNKCPSCGAPIETVSTLEGSSYVVCSMGCGILIGLHAVVQRLFKT